MQLIIAAMGKARPKSPEMLLMEEYVKRLPWKLKVHELEPQKSGGKEQRKAVETTLLMDACASCNKRIVLDENGELLTSREFAGCIQKWQNHGASSLGFIIGGSDGLAAGYTKAADLRLSFGRMSFPHMLVRALLAEQLYRAYTLLHNHPYHRE